MASEDSEVKHFFEHVLNRTEEILNQTSNTSDEQHSEVLTHLDLSPGENGKINRSIGKDSYERN